MKKSFELISTVGMTLEQWLKEREHGIGGSDVGAILGVDKFKPSVKLFHQKVGTWQTDENDNIAMYAGRVSEDHVYHKYWKYWSPDAPEEEKLDVFLENAKSDNIIRTSRRVNAIITNPKYPWLRANIDRRINKVDGKGNGILELKTGNSKYWNQYEAEIPTTYLWQVQHYMAVTEYDYAEIFGLLDGRFPVCFEIPRNENMIEALLERTESWWEKVKMAQEIFKDSTITKEEKHGYIAELEPPVESTEAYENYMKERYKALHPSQSDVATIEMESFRKDYRIAHNISKMHDEEKRAAGNEIRNYMIQHELNELTLEDNKRITWFNNRLSIPKHDGE